MKRCMNLALLALPLCLFSQAAAASSGSSCSTHIEYVEVEAAVEDATVEKATATTDTTSSAPPSTTATNTTTVLGPIPDPFTNTSSLANIVPSQNISIYYGSNSPNDSSLVNITLSMNRPTVILEYIDTISAVDCSNDSIAITFNSDASFETALQEWALDGNFTMVTNHMGDCDAEFERGFFVVDKLTSDDTSRIITVKAAKSQLDSVSKTGHFTFNSIPATTLQKRITLNPSTSLTVSESVPNNTVLFSLDDYIDITADEAYFTSTITFSGHMYYNFWTFSLKELYFDLDTAFTADVELSASVQAAYSTSYSYSPNELSYALIDVPGILQLGPGIEFAVGVDLNASAAVDVTAGLGINLPDGNVHIDVLNSDNNAATGWTPKYSSYANITEKAELQIDPSASITVELAFKLLGGLIDLSSGITATPGFTNYFKLTAEETTNGTDISVTPDSGNCAEGVELKSDFTFNVTGFATKWLSATLYSVDVPLWDYCYAWA